MIPVIAAAAGGLAASVVGGIKAAKERKKMEKYLNQQNSENQAWYNANALSDYTQRADSQNLIRNLRDNLNSQNKAAANMSVVTGATPEQQAVQKEQSNKIISDTYANLGAMGQQWKDNITSTYMARKDNLSAQKMGMMGQSAQSYENLMNSGINMMQNAAMSMGGG